eukprot:1945498-Prymnesium_polylepis.1
MRYLHGLFESASHPAMDLCPDYLKKRAELGRDERSGSPFPAQVWRHPATPAPLATRAASPPRR